MKGRQCVVMMMMVVVLCCVVNLVVAQGKNPRLVRVIQSDPTGNLLKDVGTIWLDNLLPPVPPYPDTIAINSSARYQEIIGFGAALSDSAAYTFAQAGAANQKLILDAFWGNGTDSIQFTVARVVIGACDYSLTYHSYDDSPGDEGLRNFSVQYDDTNVIPFIKRAYAQSGNKLKLLGSPWSPPAWMKTNNGFVNGGSLKPALYQTMANYMSRYIDEYKARGLPIWGVTPQNEPEYGPIDYPGCLYTAQEEANFIKTALGPTLAKNHPGVNILGYDHNRDDVYDWAKVFYADADVTKYLWGIAFHWYAQLPYFNNVLLSHNLAPTKGLLQSEASQDNSVQTDWERGETYAYDIINDLNVWSQGFLQWNIILQDDGKGHYGPFKGLSGVWGTAQPPIGLRSGNQLYKYPSYYFIAHFSKYIPPGSVRIGAVYNFTTPSLYSTAFLNPSKQVVLVILNMNAFEVDLKLTDSGNTAIPRVPGKGIVTLIYDSYSTN